MIQFLLEIITGYLIADFLSGLFHWFRDTYFTPHTQIIGKYLIWPSRLHHIKPRYITEFSDLHLAFQSGYGALLSWWMWIIYFYPQSIFLWSLFIFISLNDVFHKYTHTTATETPNYIIFLQNIGILQTHRDHHIHHTEPFIKNYCPISPYVNTLLESVYFWRRLENLIEFSTGTKPRHSEDIYVLDPTYPAGIKFVEFRSEKI